MENIFKRLEFVIKESEEITKHFHETKSEEVTFLCLSILDRLNFSSESLKILIEKFNGNIKVEYSCGIIIRSILLDYLIVLNAHEICERNESDTGKLYTELQNFCLMMLCDTPRNTLKYFESLKDIIPKDSLDKMYIDLVVTNQECFESYNNDGSTPVIKIKEYKTPAQLFGKLMSSKSLRKYRYVYEAYLFYSKYEHFGRMFYGLSRKKAIEQLASINEALKEFPKILLFTVNLLETLYVSDDFLKEKTVNIVSFIDNF